jgi:hypothetical protein
MPIKCQMHKDLFLKSYTMVFLGYLEEPNAFFNLNRYFYYAINKLIILSPDSH